ncbi:hypothetical protein [Pseudoalteromonas luteoviolacea]|uniref:hypothetical protein n=1 Tax=Pseudoalteromonas luteoviolacea TaxID=43657 RepID=UPI00114F960E|nr:hypothetical protein [Pseudoalteromonas luteoviolacea]TQF70327.1 hypothetical protein FLM44_04325 [Pseudoalteromonas luteoviolacea]
MYFVFFSILWDKVFPYYYEEVLSEIFIIGLALIISMPLIWALYNPAGIGGHFNERYLKFCKKASLVVIAICLMAFVYQHSGILSGISSESKYYKVVPMNN